MTTKLRKRKKKLPDTDIFPIWIKSPITWDDPPLSWCSLKIDSAAGALTFSPWRHDVFWTSRCWTVVVWWRRQAEHGPPSTRCRWPLCCSVELVACIEVPFIHLYWNHHRVLAGYKANSVFKSLKKRKKEVNCPCFCRCSQSARQGRSSPETKLQTSGDYSVVAKEPLDTLCAFGSTAVDDWIILEWKKQQKMGQCLTTEQTCTQVFNFVFILTFTTFCCSCVTDYPLFCAIRSYIRC